jgi:ribosomal protein S18 acetylase RimI-like enzyme
MVTASWTSPEQALVRDWIWPEHLNEIDRIGVGNRFALVLTHDDTPAGVACCHCDRSENTHFLTLDFLYLQRAFWEPNLWEEAIACVRDRLAQDAHVRRLYLGSSALTRFAGDRDTLQRLGFTRHEVYCYFVINLDTALPDVAVPTGYALVPWRDDYRSRVEPMNVEMPLILGGLIENRHLHLDRRASHVALRGEEVCGAILVREPMASGSSFVDYLLVTDAHRRRGLGRALEVRAMADLRTRGVACLGSCVSMSNTAMLALKKELHGVPLGFTNLSCVWNAPAGSVPNPERSQE